MKYKFEDTCMIEIKVGDKVRYVRNGRIGVVEAISLVPNGTVHTDRTLVALLNVSYPTGSTTGTSDKFEPVGGVLYFLNDKNIVCENIEIRKYNAKLVSNKK